MRHAWERGRLARTCLSGDDHAYPDVVLDVIAEDRLVDIVAERFDAGVRLGEMVEKDMIAVRLGGEMEMMVVAAPSYIERFGAPETPRDLRSHRCINIRWPSGGLYRWEFERGEEKLEASVAGPLIVNEPDVAARAALDGVGVAFLFGHQARPLLGAGKLVRLLEEWTPPFRVSIFIIRPDVRCHRRCAPSSISSGGSGSPDRARELVYFLPQLAL